MSTIAAAEGPSRKAYMSKEQLEAYLLDLRNNRPQRPSSSRPLSAAARSRWSAVRSSTGDIPTSSITPSPDTTPTPTPGTTTTATGTTVVSDPINHGPPTLLPITTTPSLSRRESRLIRKHSATRHGRSHTISSIRSFASLRAGSRERDVAVVDDDDYDHDTSRPTTANSGVRPALSRRAKRDSVGSAGGGGGFRSGLAGLVGQRPGTASSVSSASSGYSETRMKGMFGSSGGATTTAGGSGSPTPTSAPSVVKMPPVHPPRPEDAPMIEKELALHFSTLGMKEGTNVAPLRIGKTEGRPASSAGVPTSSTTTTNTTTTTTPATDEINPSLTRERSSTLPGSTHTAPFAPRKVYIDPWKHEPTQLNKVQYTTNPDPLPSPPMSETEEAEILKDLGRRPLPRVAGPRGMTPPEEKTVRRNQTRYGAQVMPPQPPVVGVVYETETQPQKVVRTNTAPAGKATEGAGRIRGPRVQAGNVLGPRGNTVVNTPASAQNRPLPSISVASAPAAPTVNTTPRPLPAINVSSTPPVPSINISPTPARSIPSINISPTPPIPSTSVSPNPPIPTISFPDDDPPPASRPIPSISLPISSDRPLPRPASSTTSTSTSTRASTTSSRSTATCNHCRDPIQGRIVSAASLRFHPTCFRCAHCATSLEHVGFFPEPAEARQSRLAALNSSSSTSGSSSAPSPPVRFYCHLDFHELFSPRCRTCTTPIESSIILALGHTYHEGHFFCAECGDPFTSTSRFVEKDGYAWCTGCYAKRYAGKCCKCRRPVVEMVVKALGREWHEECFNCGECGGGFEGGRFFVRGGGEGGEGGEAVCVRCEERRLKM
ncbi:hypothetical protein EX30DRAFT_359681 [Ascodesmis nigricans]|uniref:LIM zinc-binding domain-containing protein n=1 Tax=Ascodesmis nigricans TaxID=341454 RepID=A0A4S2MP10_9PEZI|nr:hypothetical protein EX30DRAFT_359681 [Ascodesmis nigricans]